MQQNWKNYTMFWRSCLHAWWKSNIPFLQWNQWQSHPKVSPSWPRSNFFTDKKWVDSMDTVCGWETSWRLNGVHEHPSQLMVVQSDITKVKVDAIVHPTNADFSMAGEVGNTLSKKGGKKFQAEVAKVQLTNGSIPSAGGKPCPMFMMDEIGQIFFLYWPYPNLCCYYLAETIDCVPFPTFSLFWFSREHVYLHSPSFYLFIYLNATVV